MNAFDKIQAAIDAHETPALFMRNFTHGDAVAVSVELERREAERVRLVGVLERTAEHAREIEETRCSLAEQVNRLRGIEKLTVPWGPKLDKTRDLDVHARFGCFAATSGIEEGLRIYSITHVPTGRMVHGNFGDGLAAITCAEELWSTFPDAEQWRSPPSVQTKEDGRRSREIVEKHRERDAWVHAFD